MGVQPRVLNVSRLQRGFPAYDETWAALDDLEVPEGVHLATNYTARLGLPARIREGKRLAERFAARDAETGEAARKAAPSPS